jgi:hypothetical protein
LRLPPPSCCISYWPERRFRCGRHHLTDTLSAVAPGAEPSQVHFRPSGPHAQGAPSTSFANSDTTLRPPGIASHVVPPACPYNPSPGPLAHVATHSLPISISHLTLPQSHITRTHIFLSNSLIQDVDLRSNQGSGRKEGGGDQGPRTGEGRTGSRRR